MQRRLEQERSICRELHIREEHARAHGETVSSRTRGQVVSEHRRQRINREYSEEKARKEHRAAQDGLHRQGRAFRDQLVALGVSETEMRNMFLAVSKGDFSVLQSAQGAWSRLKNGWREGGLFRAVRDVFRPSQSALMEHARSFYEAGKLLDYWQQEKDRHLADHQRDLRGSSSLN